MLLLGYLIIIAFFSVTSSALARKAGGRENLEIVQLVATRYQRGYEKAHHLIKADLRSGTTTETCMVDWLALDDPYDYFVVCNSNDLRMRVRQFESLSFFKIDVEETIKYVKPTESRSAEDGASINIVNKYVYWTADLADHMRCDPNYSGRPRTCELEGTLDMYKTEWPIDPSF